MSQGTVTDYFPKKRKQAVLPATKRPKMSSPLLDDDLSSPGSLRSMEKVIQTKAQQKSVKARRKKSNRMAEKDIVTYFQEITDSNPNSEQSDKPNTIATEVPTKHGLEERQFVGKSDPVLTNVVKYRNAETFDVVASTSNDTGVAETHQGNSTSCKQNSIGIKISDSTGSEISETVAKLLPAKRTESLKEKLKSRGDLKSLQESLMKMHRLKKKQKEREMKSKIVTTEKFDSSTKPTTSNNRKFAYETLHSLSEKVPESLHLPQKFKLLADLFQCLDLAVSIYYNRKQAITWNNVQKSVREMSRKNFELYHLAQIKSIFPSAYLYRQEKGMPISKERSKHVEYQLTLEPTFEQNDHFGGEKKLTSSMLVNRRHHFSIKLMNRVREHHIKFLAHLSPPIEIPEGKEIRRWHPQFALDSVPDIEEAQLPQPPEKFEKCTSAKDLIDKVRGHVTKRALDALKKVAEKTSESPEMLSPSFVEENNNECRSKVEAKVKTSEMKGISASLLAKVRAKEAGNKLKTMFRSEEQERKIKMLENLPEIVRTMRSLYSRERRSSLALEYTCEELVKCSSSVTTDTAAKEHIKYLLYTFPDWLHLVQSKNMEYIKMTLNIDINSVLQKLILERRKVESMH